jgi:hypothetical protein
LLKTHQIWSEWRRTTTMLLRNHCRNICLEHDFSSGEKHFLLVGGRRNRQFLIAKLFHSLSIIHCVDRARAREWVREREREREEGRRAWASEREWNWRNAWWN